MENISTLMLLTPLVQNAFGIKNIFMSSKSGLFLLHKYSFLKLKNVLLCNKQMLL